MDAWPEVLRRGAGICIQGTRFIKLSEARAGSLLHFLERSLRLCVIILMEQFRFVRYKRVTTLSFYYWIVSVERLFPAEKLTPLMTVGEDALIFFFFLLTFGIKIVLFQFLKLFCFYFKLV